jgi:hypothetical protein
LSVSRPIEVVVLNCWVTEMKDTSWASNNSTSLANILDRDRVETAKRHGSSFSMDRRIADKQILAHEVTAWQDHRNKHHAKADWQFTTANARVKLKRLYPQFE